jgi:hypothetical protein
MTDNIFAGASAGARPTGHPSDLPIVGTLFQGDKGSEFSSKMYDQATDLTQAKHTLDAYIKQGDKSRAKEFLQEHRKDIVLEPLAAAYSREMGTFEQQEMLIRNHPQMPGDVKQARLDGLDSRRTQLSRQFSEALTRMKQKLAVSAG